MIRIGAALLLAGFLGACATAEKRPFTRGDVIDGFDRVAFGREFSPEDSPVLVKFDEPVRILVVHAEGDREPLLRVRKVIRRIKTFHRHPEFRPIDTLSIEAYTPARERNHNMVIFAVPGRHWDRVHARVVAGRPNAGAGTVGEAFYYYRCGGTLNNDGGRMTRALIFLDTEQNADRDGIGYLDECFAEEMLQSMGLPDDSDELVWSMFNDSNDVKWPGDFDNLLMSILYTPELAAGMPREEVRQRVPRIVDELWPEYLAERRRRGAGKAGS